MSAASLGVVYVVICAFIEALAQIAYWESALKKMSESPDWRKYLEKNLWENSFTGAEGSRKALQVQYEEMRAGLAELGLAKH